MTHRSFIPGSSCARSPDAVHATTELQAEAWVDSVASAHAAQAHESVQARGVEDNFFNLYHHDFVRVAVAIPQVRVANPEWNAQETCRLLAQAVQARACLVLFPELGLTGYSCDDLFQQEALLSAALRALNTVVEATRTLPVLAAVGLPLRQGGALYNVCAVLCAGKILGIVPKTYIPNYREFYEGRQFTAASFVATAPDWLNLPGHAPIPFGTRLLFRATNQPLLTIAAEICEDLWVPIAPSSHATLAGATLILNPSASNATIGKAAYRQQLVANQSARCLTAYLYSAAGVGESTTDLAWDGHGLIADHGELKAQSQRYCTQSQWIMADIDLLRLQQERMRQNTFQVNAQHLAPDTGTWQVLPFELPVSPQGPLPLLVPPARYPYVPALAHLRDARCEEVFQIQVQGLASRLRATGLKRLVLGVSGGLDSTHALLVCLKVLEQLQLPISALLAYTMPGFATSAHTLSLAHSLMHALGVTPQEIDIRPSCLQMFKDIGHPFHEGHPVYDITFENVQAGERTSHLFRLANLHGALVVGTSDLSELALGWSTYGVGDHMAHYHVNASVPKTLIQYLIAWVRDTGGLVPEACQALTQVLQNDISPELIPATSVQALQRTEDSVGPYALQDFNLYHVLRFGFSPYRVGFLAWCAWGDTPALCPPANSPMTAPGRFPATGSCLGESPAREVSPPEGGNEAATPVYPLSVLRNWLTVFVTRFFKNSQFKRSCMANAPKVGSGGSLSPRGDWRAPSDGSAAPWIASVDRIPLDGPSDRGDAPEYQPPQQGHTAAGGG